MCNFSPRKEWGRKNIWIIMVKLFPKLMKAPKPQIQKSKWTTGTRRINRKKTTSRHIILKLLRTSNSLKSSKRKRHTKGGMFRENSMYVICSETDHQPRWDAWDKCSGLVHWADPEEWSGEGGGRVDRDGEYM